MGTCHLSAKTVTGKRFESLNKKFLLLWTGQFLSKTGSGISAFAVGVYILEKTRSTTMFSMLLLAYFLPSVLLNPIGGIIADRKDRRLMIASGDLGSAAGVLVLIIFSLFFYENYILIFTGVSVISIFSALHSPSYKASITEMLDKSQYSKAAGLMQLSEASGYVLSPAIASLLLSRVSLAAVLGIDFASFIIAAVSALLAGKSFAKNRGTVSLKENINFKRDFMSGIIYISGEKKIIKLLLLIAFITFLTAVLQTLFTPIILSLSNAETLGLVQSISSSGMVFGSLFLGLVGWKRDHMKSLKFSTAAAGIFFFMTGFSTDIPRITVSAFCLFIILPLINTEIDVLFRVNIDNRIQGKIWSLISLVTQTGMVLSFLCTGFLAEAVFNPMLTDNGVLADSIGRIIGTGPARGSSFMVVISGFLLLITGAAI